MIKILVDAARKALAVGVVTLPLAGTAQAGGHFVYTVDDTKPNTVTTFSVAPDGSLTNLGQTPTGGNSCGGTGGLYASRRNNVSRNGDLLLVANSCGEDVSVLSGASTGSLVLETTIPVSTIYLGASIVSDGKCIVIGSGNVITSFRFPDFALVGSVTVRSGLYDMKIGKPGPSRYVAAALPYINQVAVIPLVPSTCALGTPSAISTSGSGEPAGVDFSPKSDILYVGDAKSGSTIVEAFTFPAGTPLPGSPYSYATGSNANTVLASKNGKCLFVANQASASVTAIPLAAGIPGATATAFPVGSGGHPAGMANDVTGKMFYVASGWYAPGPGTNTVTTEIIGAGCALTQSPSGPVGTGVTGAWMFSLAAFP